MSRPYSSSFVNNRPLQSLPLRGRWHGEAVTDEGEMYRIRRKPVLHTKPEPHLISQKSKIFASFPKGEAFFLLISNPSPPCCFRW